MSSSAPSRRRHSEAPHSGTIQCHEWPGLAGRGRMNEARATTSLPVPDFTRNEHGGVSPAANLRRLSQHLGPLGGLPH